MDRFSSFDRVVGDISDKEKNKIFRDKHESFNDQVFEDLEHKERKKTPEEIQIIALANKMTNEIRQKYGLGKFDIPLDNIHIINEDAWSTREDGVAFYQLMSQRIVLKEQSAKIVFVKKMIHEMLHFKSYSALQVTKGDHLKLKEYRSGLTMNTRDGKKNFFSNLNEAITEEITKKLVVKLFDHLLFAQEIKETNNVIEKYSRAVTASGEPLFNKDTFYAKTEYGKLKNESSKTQHKTQRISSERFTFSKERKILNILINKLFEKNADKFQSTDEIFEIFAKGMLTGNILVIGKLIDRTFGSGILRQIGELGKDIDGQYKFVDSL